MIGRTRPLHLLICAVAAGSTVSFSPPVSLSPRDNTATCAKRPTCTTCASQRSDDGDSSDASTSDSSSKGIVSSLTGFVNLIMGSSSNPSSNDEDEESAAPAAQLLPPSSPAELLSKIRDDYVINNYLWTGDIYLPAFEEECRFTDPTLSFTGRDTFINNVQNLRPIVDSLIEEGGCESRLLDISLNEKEGYVQSRWNMVGDLTGLPWKPRIDVIGRTKFWYRTPQDGKISGVQVFFYDEEWEIPAAKALLQLVTRAGTISNGLS